MQLANNSRIQNQVTTDQHKVSGRVSAHSVKFSQNSARFALPEDVVTLSSGQSSMQDATVNKKPSIPVTEAERKALRESFAVYA